jgi:flavodoxin
MNTLVVYDSVYGSTKKIAETIGRHFDPQATGVLSVTKMNKVDLSAVDLLIVGSPTYGGQPTKAIQAWLTAIGPHELTGKRVAAFDTRMYEKEQPLWLRFIMKIIDYAAPKIERVLVEKGGRSVARASGFLVATKEGPLKNGEVEQALQWTQDINTRFRNG